MELFISCFRFLCHFFLFNFYSLKNILGHISTFMQLNCQRRPIYCSENIWFICYFKVIRVFEYNLLAEWFWVLFQRSRMNRIFQAFSLNTFVRQIFVLFTMYMCKCKSFHNGTDLKWYQLQWKCNVKKWKKKKTNDWHRVHLSEVISRFCAIERAIGK